MKCWYKLQLKVKANKNAENKIKSFLRAKVLSWRVIEMFQKRKMRRRMYVIRKKLAFLSIKKFWTKKNLSYNKIMENIRSYNLMIENEAKSLDRDSPVLQGNIGRQEKDGHALLESIESKKGLKKVRIKKSSKEHTVLPTISITPTYKSLQTKSSTGSSKDQKRAISENKLQKDRNLFVNKSLEKGDRSSNKLPRLSKILSSYH